MTRKIETNGQFSRLLDSREYETVGFSSPAVNKSARKKLKALNKTQMQGNFKYLIKKF